MSDIIWVGHTAKNPLKFLLKFSQNGVVKTRELFLVSFVNEEYVGLVDNDHF
jgi:hypothetical protein